MATVVLDHAQLAAAIMDLDVEEIVFGADIELDGGITIPATKETLIFNGEYNGVIHNFTDMDSILYERTINVDSVSNISLTFKNMTMTGRNFYGIPCIYDSVDTSGVSVNYENVNYVGPQLVHNPQGLTRFKNCNIIISHASAHEAGEVCQVEFEGENTIVHNAPNDTTKAVLWFRGAAGRAYFRVQPEAKLTVTTGNYFMNTTNLYNNYVDCGILQDASFALHSHKGFSYTSSHRVSSFLVERGASFRYIQDSTNLLYASLYMNESFIVNEGASVYMQANYSGAQPLIYFASGTGYQLSINNPKSFVLYDSANVPIDVPLFMSRDYYIEAEQLNHWTSARAFPEAGTFDDTPQHYWHNSDWEAFSMYGEVGSGSTSVYSSELENPQFPITDFSFQNARVISAGNLLIEPDPVIDNGRPITGQTEPEAELIISFEIGDDPYIYENIIADDDGRFELDPGMQIPPGTPIYISVNTPFLIKKIETIVLPEGNVAITSAPEKIIFTIPPVSTNPVLLRRSEPDLPVQVLDSRPYPTRWRLMASISGPLKTESGEEMENAVIYKDDEGILWDLSDTPIAVYMAEAATGTTNVIWPFNEGILVRVSQPIRSGTEYTTLLGWNLDVEDET